MIPQAKQLNSNRYPCIKRSRTLIIRGQPRLFIHSKYAILIDKTDGRDLHDLLFQFSLLRAASDKVKERGAHAVLHPTSASGASKLHWHSLQENSQEEMIQ